MVVLLRLDERLLERLGELLEAITLGRHVGKGDLSVLREHLDLLGGVGNEVGGVIPEDGVVDGEGHSHHFVELLEAAGCGVEEVELVELLADLETALADFVVAQQGGRLLQLLEAFLRVDLLGRLEGYVEVAALDGEAEALVDVLLEEESYLGVSLLLEVVHNGVALDRALAQDLFDLHEVLLLQRHLEQIVGVVDLDGLHLAGAVEGVDRVLHEERDVEGVLDALEGA
mmetsp:Transcript_7397/g.12489  ORF Transcript_7397/g.12489 Transcript_7397/m.12489 type:complete len:229 (-) Transcript_7397:1689-2375(-)